MVCDSNDRVGVGVRMKLVVEMCDSDDRAGVGVMYGSGGAGLG